MLLLGRAKLPLSRVAPVLLILAFPAVNCVSRRHCRTSQQWHLAQSRFRRGPRCESGQAGPPDGGVTEVGMQDAAAATTLCASETDDESSHSKFSQSDDESSHSTLSDGRRTRPSRDHHCDLILTSFAVGSARFAIAWFVPKACSRRIRVCARNRLSS
jgi:hypothetical protein